MLSFYNLLNEIFIVVILLISLCFYTILQKKYSKTKDYLYFQV
jgi:hypothetical protein